MTRVVAAAHGLAWPRPVGAATGNHPARGVGTFPRWQVLAVAVATWQELHVFSRLH